MNAIPPTSRLVCPGCGVVIEGFAIGDSCPNCQRHFAGLCHGCGYDLRGLPIDSRCPECAKLIIDSLRGDLLFFADHAYLLALRRGVACVLASILFMVCSTIAAIAVGIAVAGGATIPGLSNDAIHYITIAVTVFGSGLSIYGWFLFSQPDAGVTLLDPGDRPRRILRIAVVTSGALAVLSTILDLLAPPSAPGTPLSPFDLATGIVTVAGLAAWAVQFFSAMLYLQWLGRRIPHNDLIIRSRRNMWLLPVLYIPGLLLCGLGPLIALILYYNLLNDYRKILKRIIAQQPAA